MAFGGFTERLALLITADTSGAVREIKQLGNESEKSLGKARTSTDKWAAGLTTGGAAAVGFAAVAGAGLLSFAKASEEAEKQQIKLETALDNSATISDKSTTAFENQATALAQVTVVDDDATKGAQALLIQMGLTTDEVMTLTPLVLDLARAKGITAEQAAKLAAKSTDGAASLKRMGIEVDETKLKTDGFGATVEALQGSVGGFAEREGATFSGQLAILKNQLGEVAEGIGVGVVDALSNVLGPLTAVSSKFGEMDAGTQSAIGTFGTFGVAALGAAGAVSFVAGQVLGARDRFARLRTETPRTAAALGVLGKAAAGVGLAIAGIQIIDAVFGDADKSAENIDDLSRSLRDFADGQIVAGLLAEKFGGDLDGLAGDVKEVYDRFHDQSGTDAFAEGVENAAAVLPGFGTKTNDAENRLDDLDKALAAIAATNAPLAERIFADLTETLAAQGVTTEQMGSVFNDYENALIDSGNAASDAATATDTNTTALDENGDEVVDLTALHKDHAAALKEAEDRQRGFTDAVFGTRDAARDLITSGIELTQKITEYNTAAADGTTTSTELALAEFGVQEQIDKVAASAKAAAEQQAELNGTTVTAKDSALLQKAALEGLRDTIDDKSPFRGYLNSLIRDLDDAARNRQGTLDVAVTVNGQRTSAASVLNNPDAFGLSAPVGDTGGTFRAPAGQSHGLAVLQDGEILDNSPNNGRGGGITVVQHIAGSVISERDLIRIAKNGAIAARRKGFAT